METPNQRAGKAGGLGAALKGVFSPAVLARTYQDPLALANLGVDLLPVVAVLSFGWGAAPLVALYWLENLVIGVFTILRMLAAGTQNGVFGLGGALFMSAFFTVHYGMFCFGHGVFLYTFAGHTDFPGPSELVSWAAGSGAHMGLFLAAIAAVNLAVYLRDYIGRGEFRRTEISAEMGAPYGRIVTLHIAIILGAGLTMGLGEPLLGVLLLIVLRVVFGMVLTVGRRLKLEGAGA
ncbi:DUF6498-containing protein [Hyphomonas sp.]|uniref:DUF6498-containing protein n=1 Tax=Hyphomonas sp. TaxID=87 RepID=UPI00391962CD